MTVFQTIVLGIVQGLGEFLPISSSAHLILIPRVFGWDDPGLTFDVALHMGTLLAVVLYFWKDWLNLFLGAVQKKPSTDKKVFWLLVIATIPAAFFGFLLEKQAESAFRSTILIGVMMIVMGILLYVADKRQRNRQMSDMTIRDAALIGLAQALAIIPGVSRSGSTMTVARFLRLTREEAARFSFLMSTPIIFGAGLVSLRHITLSDINLQFIAGVGTSFIVGLLAISFMLQFLKRSNFGLFVGYRLVVGLGVIIWAFLMKSPV